MHTETDLAWLRLLQLVSPSLPIGMYSYSQGLERAVDDGWVTDAESAGEWFGALLGGSIGRVDLPILARLYDAWLVQDREQVAFWSLTLRACRETSELRAEDRHTGQALAKLLIGLGFSEADIWQHNADATLATLFSLAAVRWKISKQLALSGYAWGWLENQVLAALKLLPLGQLAGQRILDNLVVKIPDVIEQALRLDDAEIGGGLFGLALASSRHEMQYSRLFRS